MSFLSILRSGSRGETCLLGGYLAAAAVSRRRAEWAGARKGDMTSLAAPSSPAPNADPRRSLRPAPLPSPILPKMTDDRRACDAVSGVVEKASC